MPDNNKCFSCSNEHTKELPYKNVKYYTEFGWKDVFDNRRLYLCDKCGFGYNLPFLTREVLDHFYDVEFIKKRKKYFFQSYFKFRPDINLLYRIMKFLSYASLKNNTPTFLDFGGGRGSSCENFRELYPKSKIFIDDSICYLPILKRRKLERKSLLNFQDESIDLIFSSHTFEHFNASDIDEILATIYKKLKKGGSIFIEVPNDDLKNFIDQDIYNEGSHLVHYSKTSLTNFVKRAGLKIDHVSTVGNDRKLGNGGSFKVSIDYLTSYKFSRMIERVKHFLGNNKNIILGRPFKHNFYQKIAISNQKGELIQLIATK